MSPGDVLFSPIEALPLANIELIRLLYKRTRRVSHELPMKRVFELHMWALSSHQEIYYGPNPADVNFDQWA